MISTTEIVLFGQWRWANTLAEHMRPEAGGAVHIRRVIGPLTSFTTDMADQMTWDIAISVEMEEMNGS